MEGGDIFQFWGGSEEFQFGASTWWYFDLDGGGGNFDWEGWGVNEHTFFAVRMSDFINNNRLMALLRHVLLHKYPL